MKCVDKCTVRSVYTGSDGHWNEYRGGKSWNYKYKGQMSKWFNYPPTHTLGAKTFSPGALYDTKQSAMHYIYELIVDEIFTNIWTDGSGKCAAYLPSCTPKVCTCPNGEPTVAHGNAGTLCDTATVDCSKCDTEFVISAEASAGLSQICIPVKPCTPTQVAGSDQSAAGSIQGMLIVGFFLLSIEI